ncbi:type II toxin-antitoxin system RelE/ParE family toxin [Reyranella soli]|uniref:type II toxin-antitoxin system RelE/ParE family toxin n=1 Tax=Reyranella soli TaxID=1230389 RepID=UPI0035A21ACE
MRLDFAPKAIADTQEILSALVDRAGRPVAVAYFERFRATFDRIATFPDSGAPRPRLGSGVRLAVVHPYAVIYRRSRDGAQVMRGLHGRRNITRRLLLRRSSPPTSA